MIKYKSKRIVDRLKWVIVNEKGKVINNNPSEEELKGLKPEPRKPYDRKTYNISKRDYITCPKIKYDKLCGNSIKDNSFPEKDEIGNKTGRRICYQCYRHDRWIKEKNDPNCQNNLLKSVGDRRTGNQRQDSTNAKGDLIQKVANIWKKLVCLNEKTDNFLSPLDSIDPITGLIYQIKSLKWCIVSKKYECWMFGGLLKEGFKKFDYMICYCLSKDRKTIERIYIFPYKEIMDITNIAVYRNSNYHWYDKYMINENEVKIVDKILSDVMMEIK